MNYEYYLAEKLHECVEFFGLDLKIEVNEERMINKDTKYYPNTLYVILKYLTASYSYEVKSQPVQVMCVCENDRIEDAKMILNKFTQENNMKEEKEINSYIKQNYTSPVVISNFNSVAYGFSTVLYFTGTLLIIENISDIENLKIDNNVIKPLSINISYSMSGNTQPIGNSKISKTVKSVSTVTISMNLPLIGDDFIDKVLNISKGLNSGNEDFRFTFSIHGVEFTYDMKLISCMINTAPNQVPGIQLGFMV